MSRRKPQPGRPRFTPTRVGTIRPLAALTARKPVHPHARGDDSATIFLRSNSLGSPPRAWGRFVENVADGLQDRFTPTRVGTIPSWPTSPVTAPVHPHARGDDAWRG